MTRDACLAHSLTVTCDSRLATRGSRWLLALLLGALALRLALWARAYGFEQGDPVEYVNIAYKIGFGIGIDWWDLRPLLLPVLYVPVLYLAQVWPDPSGEAMVRALRLVSVLFSVGTVALIYLLGRRLGGELVGLAAGLLVAANPVFNRLSVSTFAEVPSTFFVVLTLWLLSSGRSPRQWLLAGLALGTACMMRYQGIAFVAPIGAWTLIRGMRNEYRGMSGLRPSSCLMPHSSFLFGLAATVLAQAALETVFYGAPFHSLLVSFDYNVTSGLAPLEFGSEPFEWYAGRVAEWFGIVPFGLALLGLPALARGPRATQWWLPAAAAAAMFVALSALPHKELRFMAQIAPLLALFAGQGLANIWRWLMASPHPLARSPKLGGRGWGWGLATWRWGPVRVVWRVLAAGICAAMLMVAVGPLLWASLGLDVATNVAYSDGPKRAAALKPGGTLGTIPWFVPRPYTGSRMALERMDRKVWEDRDYVTSTVERSDFLLFPEYWLLEDRYVRRLVDADYRTLESYPNGVVLLQNRRLDEPLRRRQRPEAPG